jgi:hypothetical protein
MSLVPFLYQPNFNNFIWGKFSPRGDPKDRVRRIFGPENAPKLPNQGKVAIFRQ